MRTGTLCGPPGRFRVPQRSLTAVQASSRGLERSSRGSLRGSGGSRGINGGLWACLTELRAFSWHAGDIKKVSGAFTEVQEV